MHAERPRPKWQGYFVLCTVVIGLVLVTDGYPVEFLLLGMSVLFVLTGIVEAEDAFAGFSNKGVIALAALFCISHGT